MDIKLAMDYKETEEHRDVCKRCRQSYPCTRDHSIIGPLCDLCTVSAAAERYARQRRQALAVA